MPSGRGLFRQPLADDVIQFFCQPYIIATSSYISLFCPIIGLLIDQASSDYYTRVSLTWLKWKKYNLGANDAANVAKHLELNYFVPCLVPWRLRFFLENSWIRQGRSLEDAHGEIIRAWRCLKHSNGWRFAMNRATVMSNCCPGYVHQWTANRWFGALNTGL